MNSQDSESIETLVSHIQRLKMFHTFSSDDLYALVDKGEMLTFKKGASIVIEGENSQGLCVITHGFASVYKASHTSNQLVRLAHLEPGAIFGELSLINNCVRAATVTSETETTVFSIDADHFNLFLEEGGDRRQLEFYRNCAVDLAERFREQNEDYLNTQRLLWEQTFKKEESEAS